MAPRVGTPRIAHALRQAQGERGGGRAQRERAQREWCTEQDQSEPTVCNERTGRGWTSTIQPDKLAVIAVCFRGGLVEGCGRSALVLRSS